MDPLIVEKGWIVAPFLLALIFAFSNGFRDSSTIVATVVSTRVLSPAAAFFLCAIFEFLGALLIGSAIVTTISRSLKTASPLDLSLVLTAALSAAIVWGFISWWRAWPTSNNQALIAGLFGAGTAAWGHAYMSNRSLPVVFAILILSPLVGFLISMVMTHALFHLGQWLTPKARPLVDTAHVIGCAVVATAHGSNDAQMLMGILASILSMGTFSWIGEGAGHVSARVLVAIALAGGMMLGGRRILAKLGLQFYRIRPMQGMAVQVAAAGTILTCAFAGFPASTTQVSASSILGSGVASNPAAVRWHIAQDIVLSWLFTLPAVSSLGFLICGGLLRLAR